MSEKEKQPSKNKSERSESAILTVGDKVTRIEYCQEHYDKLLRALLERNLGPHISTDPEEFVRKLQDGKSDAAMDATAAITSTAVSLFGLDQILNGCPLCAFDNLITHIADHLAVKYTRSN